MPFHPTFITLLTCAFMVFLAFCVGRARHKFSIMPPETRGHPRFDAVFLMQQNTIESTFVAPVLCSMMAFLLALWSLWQGNPT